MADHMDSIPSYQTPKERQLAAVQELQNHQPHMCEALGDHEGSISIGGRLIINFRFADDIVVNAEEEEEAGVLIDRLDRTTTRYKMEIGPDKTKVMTNNPNGFQSKKISNDQELIQSDPISCPQNQKGNN